GVRRCRRCGPRGAGQPGAGASPNGDEPGAVGARTLPGRDCDRRGGKKGRRPGQRLGHTGTCAHGARMVAGRAAAAIDAASDVLDLGRSLGAEAAYGTYSATPGIEVMILLGDWAAAQQLIGRL